MKLLRPLAHGFAATALVLSLGARGDAQQKPAGPKPIGHVKAAQNLSVEDFSTPAQQQEKYRFYTALFNLAAQQPAGRYQDHLYVLLRDGTIQTTRTEKNEFYAATGLVPPNQYHDDVITTTIHRLNENRLEVFTLEHRVDSFGDVEHPPAYQTIDGEDYYNADGYVVFSKIETRHKTPLPSWHKQEKYFDQGRLTKEIITRAPTENDPDNLSVITSNFESQTGYALDTTHDEKETKNGRVTKTYVEVTYSKDKETFDSTVTIKMIDKSTKRQKIFITKNFREGAFNNHNLNDLKVTVDGTLIYDSHSQRQSSGDYSDVINFIGLDGNVYRNEQLHAARVNGPVLNGTLSIVSPIGKTLASFTYNPNTSMWAHDQTGTEIDYYSIMGRMMPDLKP